MSTTSLADSTLSVNSKDHPEYRRRSNGAAWTRNGQHKRLATLDARNEAPVVTRRRGCGSIRPCDRLDRMFSGVTELKWESARQSLGYDPRFLLPTGETPKATPRPTVKAPAIRLLDLPQLPASIPVRQTKRQALAQLRSQGNRLPTHGIIPLAAPKPPQAPQPTPAQRKALDDFLAAVERYFQTFSESINGDAREFRFNRGAWRLRNAELAAGQAAMQYAQFCALGI